jgi:hypothetical protein
MGANIASLPIATRDDAKKFPKEGRMDVMTQLQPDPTCGPEGTIQPMQTDAGGAETTPRAEWNELISRSRKLADAAAMTALSAAHLAVSMVALFFSVIITVFRVFRGMIDGTMTKIEVPGKLGPGSSDRERYIDLTISRSFPDQNMTAMREGIRRLRMEQHPSATLLPR